MAAALRVSVMAHGPFGGAVADALLPLRPHGSVRRVPTDPAVAFVDADVVVAAMWRPEPALADRVDAIAFAEGKPWLPVVLEHPFLRVGPFVSPSDGPCHGCYAARRRQHAAVPSLEDALHAHYADDPDAGPRGFLPPLAMLAAGAVADVLDDPAASVGRVRRLDVVSMDGGSGHVVGVDGCTRCGPTPAERARAREQFAADVRAVLA